MRIEAQRLYMREMVDDDFASLCKILCDEQVMYAYEGAFDIKEATEWYNKQRERYVKYGFGLWAVILKETGEMIGQCGLTMQAVHDKEVLEIGYLFNKDFWHKGYAIEAATACKEFAFNTLNANEVFSIIRDNNLASRKVAIANGMSVKDEIIKYYRGVTMPHIVYSVSKQK